MLLASVSSALSLASTSALKSQANYGRRSQVDGPRGVPGCSRVRGRLTRNYVGLAV